MKNRCKNNKTILLNKNPYEYFENNYQQFSYQNVMKYRKNTLIPFMGKRLKPNAERLTCNFQRQKCKYKRAITFYYDGS